MSIYDEKVLNDSYPEAGSGDPAYCRGKNQIIGKDTELLMSIIQKGLREYTINQAFYIAKDILKKFKRRED